MGRFIIGPVVVFIVLLPAFSMSPFSPQVSVTEIPTASAQDPRAKPELTLYLAGVVYEKKKQYQAAGEKYLEALGKNPTFILARQHLNGLAQHLLTDHRETLNQYPGYSKKPRIHDSTALYPAVIFDDIVDGYLLLYDKLDTGIYGIFSLKGRHFKHTKYLLVYEDKTWQQFPSITLNGVTRIQDILVYH